MSDQTELLSNIDDFTASSPVNALSFFVKSLIRQSVSTAIPVVVTSVTRSGSAAGAGYLSCKPLIMQRSASGETLPNVEIPRVPYFRYQHGSAGFLCDPKVGDVGIAVFAQSDCSNLSGGTDPVAPGSFRAFDMSDGFYIGGFWGKPCTTFVRVEDSGGIEIESSKTVTVKTKTCQVEADEITATASKTFTVNAPKISLNGAISGGGSGGANANFTGDVTASGISLVSHVHSGCGGNSNSGTPVK